MEEKRRESFMIVCGAVLRIFFLTEDFEYYFLVLVENDLWLVDSQ